MDMEREEGHFDDVSGHYVEGTFFFCIFPGIFSRIFLAFLLSRQKATLIKSTLYSDFFFNPVNALGH